MNFSEIFEKKCNLLQSYKSHKKTVLHHLHIKYIFEKLCICSHLLRKFLRILKKLLSENFNFFSMKDKIETTGSLQIYPGKKTSTEAYCCVLLYRLKAWRRKYQCSFVDGCRKHFYLVEKAVLLIRYHFFAHH